MGAASPDVHRNRRRIKLVSSSSSHHYERLPFHRQILQRRWVLGGSIAFVMTIVLFVVVNVLFASSSSYTSTTASLRGSGGGRDVRIGPNTQPFNQDARATSAKHLIVVAGHSVTISGKNLDHAGTDEDIWFLLDYQRGKGLPQAIVSHIQAGIDMAHNDEESLLIFSGGETRAIMGPLTEASSYFRVADAMDLWSPDQDDGHSSTVRARTVTEEFATDSFENLLFSICRFKEVTGSYPEQITVVSFSFKRRRFETLHIPAIQWPNDHFSYIGIDPPASTGFDLEAAAQGEHNNAARHFQVDPYGCHSDLLQEKRRERNPFSRTPPYELTCPEIRDLLHYCGPKPFPKSKLPWNKL